MLDFVPIPAFQDNYIWTIINQDEKICVIIDPGDANPVNNFLSVNNLKLDSILVTHHHWDHTGGVVELADQHKVNNIYGPHNPNIRGITTPLKEGDTINLESINTQFHIAEIPAHTLDHIAYMNEEHIFCGDTLFSAGCGRLFEGTAEQMFASLQKLTKGMNKTKLYPAHEYTLANLQFAKTIDPNNQDILKRLAECESLIKQHKATLPTTIGIEKLTNPFVRSINAEQLAIIRKQKDNF